MSDAKKCDRCGEFYTPRAVRQEYKIRHDENSSSGLLSADYHEQDLCMDCYRSFREWLDNAE